MKLGKTEFDISPISLGLWQAGGDLWQYEDKAMLETIQAAYDAGITSYDTARAYGNGHSESLLGKALKKHRDDIVIASKVFAPLDYDSVIQSCNDSLQSLGFDAMDLFYIHWPSGSFGDPVVAIEETLSAFNELKKQGKIKAIGVSNFNLDQLKEAQQYAQIDAIQNPYSLAWQRDKDSVLPYCLQEEITYFAYSPLAAGLLTGKYRDFESLEGNQRLRSCINISKPNAFEKLQALLDAMEVIAKEKATNIAGIALAWLIKQGIAPIAGASRPSQAIANANAMEIKLNDAEASELGKLGELVDKSIDQERLWDVESARKLRES